MFDFFGSINENGYNFNMITPANPSIQSGEDILNRLSLVEAYINDHNISEAKTEELFAGDYFRLKVIDVDRYIKANNMKEITNPTFFDSFGSPTIDGLLSNQIFGITQFDRSGIYGYIDLVEDFIDPSCYKVMLKVDTKFKAIVNATKRFNIDKNGVLVEDPINGGTGIKWLKQNFSKLSFARPGESKVSRRRDLKVRYLQLNYEQGKLFTNKFIVIPPYYRDVNTTGKYTGVGQINTFYVNLIVAARALRENNNYGLSMSDTTCARIQETMKAIYDWFCGNNNNAISDKGTGLSGKMGIIKRANLSKTADYSATLVMSAPELKVESYEDLMVNLDRSAAPLAAVIADFYPFMIFHLRKFFENEFLNKSSYDVYHNGEVIQLPLIADPMSKFDDDTLKKKIKHYLYSFDNRITPIEVPIDYNSEEVKKLKVGNKKLYMVFRGTNKASEYGSNPEPITKRDLTWVDVLYICAKKSSEGKIVSFTRFPIDSVYNTIYTELEVASTTETEKVYINGEFYRFYPKIRQEDINAPSGNKFVDTIQICNLYLKGMGGDYDGDTGVLKGSYFKETNDELRNFTNSKTNFIDLGCSNIRTASMESIQAIYNLTKVLPEDRKKIRAPVWK